MTVRDAAELECREVVEVVSDFLDGELTHEERAQIEQHLLVCPPCTLHVAQVKAIIARLAGLRSDPLAPGGSQGLVDVFRQWAKKRAPDGDV